MVKIVMIVALCIIAGVTVSKAEFNKDEAVKKFMEYAAECQKEAGAADSDLQDMIQKKPAAGKPGNCMRACIMKKYKVMNDSGKFDKTVALEHANTYAGADAEKMKKAKEIADACADIVVPDDHCEASALYMTCLKDQAVAHGLDKFEL